MKLHAGASVFVVLFLLLSGCGRPASRARAASPAVLLSIEELLGTLPEFFGRQRVWSLDREPALSASLVDPGRIRMGMSLSTHARTRLFVLKGTLRIRAGAEERMLGAGSYVSIPRGMLRRISPTGAGQVLYLQVLTPDMDKDDELESPATLPLRPAPVREGPR